VSARARARYAPYKSADGGCPGLLATAHADELLDHTELAMRLNPKRAVSLRVASARFRRVASSGV
jgi:hypothetical protein